MTLSERPLRARKDLPLTRLLPNMLTLISLSSGLTGIRFALLGRWNDAALAIVIAGVFDVLDGRVARMLNIASKFGAELDSLSDVVSFGVAPAIIIYEWTLKDVGGFGWIAVLVFAVCCALRLARFNTMLEDHTMPLWAKSYFTGVPAPAGAGLALLPLFAVLEFGDGIQLPEIIIAFWLIITGGLMVSRLPTFAIKGWRVAPIWVAPIFVVMGLLIAAVITTPWLTLSGLTSIYALSLPIAWYTYRRRQQSEGTAIDQSH
jgi:CDP-diacylglycerol--serine O-phosphatidyltransferase